MSSRAPAHGATVPAAGSCAGRAKIAPLRRSGAAGEVWAVGAEAARRGKVPIDALVADASIECRDGGALNTRA